MSLRDIWEGLSPRARRGLVMGGAATALVAVIALAAGGRSGPASPAEQRQRLVQNLLTDADPRALGLEGLAEQLRRLEMRTERLAAGLEKVSGTPLLVDPERDALIEGLRRDQRADLEALRAEIGALRAAAEPAPGPPPERPAGPPASAPAAPFPEAPARRGAGAERPPRALEQLFEPPAASFAEAAPGAGRAPPKAPAIRLITAPAAAAPTPAPGEVLTLPAGSLLQGVFLTGMDAPTGRGARRDPYPALVRLRHEALLPNRFRADLRECFLLVAGYGDLSAERAYLRSESLACVRADGGVLEVPVDGYATGDDGKLGVRGRLVSKQGQVIAKAMQVSFIEGFAQIFNQVPVSVIATGTAGASQPFQQVLGPEALQSGALKGTGRALERLAGHFLDLAEDMFPIIEIDAGRAVELVLTRGATLRAGPAAGGRS